jgi:hypothetical protein
MYTNVSTEKVEEYQTKGYEVINFFSDGSYHFIEMKKTQGNTGYIIFLQMKNQSEYENAIEQTD